MCVLFSSIPIVRLILHISIGSDNSFCTSDARHPRDDLPRLWLPDDLPEEVRSVRRLPQHASGQAEDSRLLRREQPARDARSLPVPYPPSWTQPPGVLGGLLSAIMAGLASEETYGYNSRYS